MRSSWPVLVGVFAVGFAAYWYDAQNEVAGAYRVASDDPSAVVANGGDARGAGQLQASSDSPAAP